MLAVSFLAKYRNKFSEAKSKQHHLYCINGSNFCIADVESNIPVLKRIGDIYSRQNILSKPVVAIFFVTGRR